MVPNDIFHQISKITSPVVNFLPWIARMKLIEGFSTKQIDSDWS